MEYPKINTLYKRQDKKGEIIESEYSYSMEEFNQIAKWDVEEKIDGTNVRIYLKKIDIRGRRDDSGIPDHLLKSIRTHFSQFDNLDDIILFGEGFGSNIQLIGNKYRKDPAFLLFDAWLTHRWATREEVLQLAKKYNLFRPYIYGSMTTSEIVELVKSRPLSKTAIEQVQIEGIIARTNPLMRSNLDGNPVMFKLKCKDFYKENNASTRSN